jgi:hypothetical protein
MGKRLTAGEIVRRDGREQFAFLLEHGFTGPAETADSIVTGLEYRRDRIVIDLWSIGGIEPEVTTRVYVLTASGAVSRAGARGASLSCLYVAFGRGKPQDVPENAPTLKTVAKRIVQHAAALRVLLPDVLGPGIDEAVRRCHARSLPDDWGSARADHR